MGDSQKTIGFNTTMVIHDLDDWGTPMSHVSPVFPHFATQGLDPVDEHQAHSEGHVATNSGHHARHTTDIAPDWDWDGFGVLKRFQHTWVIKY